MKNHFIRITDKGGYFGRFYWGNSFTEQNDNWGSVHFLSRSILFTGWVGFIWAVRSFT
jgi:hypothetical protein